MSTMSRRSVLAGLAGAPLGGCSRMAARWTDPWPRIGSVIAFDPGFHALVAVDAAVERIADGLTWAEGPVWLADTQALLYTDVPENTLYRWTAAEGSRVLLHPSGYGGGHASDSLREAGANGLEAAPGGSVLMADSGSRALARFDPRTGRKQLLTTHFHGRRYNSPNDLARRADGRIYFTDPPFGLVGFDDSPVKELRFNGVFRLDPDGSVQLVDDTLSFPNGVALSPDGRTLYVANCDARRALWMAYTLDVEGAAGARRVFAEAADLVGTHHPGLPDGMAVAATGHVFAAGPGGVLVFDPQGRRLGLIATGGPVSNCAFGDADGRTLYLTSQHLVARVRTRVAGMPQVA